MLRNDVSPFINNEKFSILAIHFPLGLSQDSLMRMETVLTDFFKSPEVVTHYPSRLLRFSIKLQLDRVCEVDLIKINDRAGHSCSSRAVFCVYSQ